MVVVINPSGPVHTVWTVTGTSTTGSMSTVHVRVTADPAMIMKVVLLVTMTVGVGTTKKIICSM